MQDSPGRLFGHFLFVLTVIVVTAFLTRKLSAEKPEKVLGPSEAVIHFSARDRREYTNHIQMPAGQVFDLNQPAAVYFSKKGHQTIIYLHDRLIGIEEIFEDGSVQLLTIQNYELKR